MPYCTLQDLLLGDLATSSVQDPQRFVDDASDEIDQAIGSRYVTPVNLSSLTRPASLTLKRINVYLATGGFMINVAKGDKNVHQTGLMYLQQARDALKMLVDGSYILDGATPNDSLGDNEAGAAVRNVDPVSYVENYYVNGRDTGLGVAGGYLLPSYFRP